MIGIPDSKIIVKASRLHCDCVIAPITLDPRIYGSKSYVLREIEWATRQR